MRKIFITFIFVLLFLPNSIAAEENHTGHTNWTAITADGGELSTGNYYLDSDITLTNNLTIPNNTTVTLCLNGHKLTGNGNGTVIFMSNSANFTLCDCQEGNEVNKHYYTINENGQYVFTNEKTEQYITGGVVTGGTGYKLGNVYGGAVYMESGGASGDDMGVFTMTGGTIAGNEAAYSGGGVYVYGTFTMSGNAQIVGNTIGISSSAGGGGVCLASSDAVFTMNDNAKICYNQARSGGGVYISGAKCTMNGNASISHNTCSVNGAGIYISGKATLTMNNNATVSNNVSTSTSTSGASGNGGGIYADGDMTITMNDQANISSNKAINGGGIYMDGEDMVLTINKGACISNNSATNGGGILGFAGTCNIEGGVIEKNTATDGSAIYVTDFYKNEAGTGLVPVGGCQANVSDGYIDGTFMDDGEFATISLSGGYFTSDPSDYLSEGYAVQSINEVHNEITYTYRVGKSQEQPSAEGLQMTTQTSNSLSFTYTASITEGYGTLQFAYAEGTDATEPTSEWVNASTDTETPTVTFNNLKEGTAYTIFIRFAENEVYIQSEKSSKTFSTKSKETPMFNEWSVEGKTYDGKPIEIIPPTLTGIEGVEVTGNVVLSYQKDNVSLEAAPTDAGTYTVIATYPGDENYKSVVSEPVAFTIEQAKLSEDIIYTENELTISLDLEAGRTEVTAIVTGDDVWAGGTWTWTSSDETVATVTQKEQPTTRAIFTSRSTATITAKGEGTTIITAIYGNDNYSGSVSYTVTVTKAEGPEPEEPETPDTPVTPDYPDYYNIYVDECEGVTVETSTNVVREGNSMSFTVEVADGYTAEDMVVKVKRSLFGYTDIIEPNEEGKYEIRNIYTEIYITVEGVEKEIPTGIEELQSTKVYAQDGSLYVQTPKQEQVVIISISGAVAKNETQIGLKRYDLPRGIYIVRVGTQNYKIRN